MFNIIISTNTKPHLSGIAKFGLLLSKKLKIPLLSFFEIDKLKKRKNILLSVSLNKIDSRLETQIWRFISFAEKKHISYSIFFHSFNDTTLEHTLITHANKVYSGNLEISNHLKKTKKKIETLWSPSLADYPTNGFNHTLNIFSFSMAYKIQIKYHKILAKILESTNIDYVIRFSTAFHEHANFGDFENIASSLQRIYNNKVRFYGFLSDEAINNFLINSDLYVNFFSNGARANNTTLFAAMERGCPILTNIDKFSPKWMIKKNNLIDINKLKTNQLKKEYLKKIGKEGKKAVLKHCNWEKLIEKINEKRN